MDNVNLGEEVSQQPLSSGGVAAARGGKVFSNGDVIVTLLPVNEKFPWVTPARFRPELVPEELMAPVLTVRRSKDLGQGRQTKAEPQFSPDYANTSS